MQLLLEKVLTILGHGSLCATAFFLNLSISHAQEQTAAVTGPLAGFSVEEAQKIKKISDMPVFLREAMMYSIGIAPGSAASRHVQEWMDSSEAAGNHKNPEPENSKLETLPIFAHVRFDEGKPVPEKAAITAAFAAEEKRIVTTLIENLGDQAHTPEFAAALEAARHGPGSYTEKYALKEQESQTEEEKPLRELSSCPENSTYEIPLVNPEDANTPVESDIDWLILAKPVPKDHEIVFGKHTQVMQYNAPESQVPSRMAAEQGLWCLPYRLRGGKGVLKHYLGADALKNFDEVKQGVVHETFKNRLAEYR